MTSRQAALALWALMMGQAGFEMSRQVQTIVEAVRALDHEQRQELIAALADLDLRGRKQTIDSIRGKYRHVATSTELFLERKKEDTALEFAP